MSNVSTTPQEIDLTGFEADAVPFLLQAANDVRKAEDEVGPLLWTAGQSLKFAAEHCPPGQWATYCERIGISETRARQYQQIFNRFTLAEIPKVGKQLLIELAAPSTPEAVIDAVEERIESGAPLPTVRELKEEIREAQAPAPVNHDIDRTTQEPNVAVLEGSEALDKVIAAMRKQLKRAMAICGQLDRSEWDRLEQSLQQMVEDVKHA